MDSSQFKKLDIGVFSSAQSVAGQGVGSAYEEQVALLQNASDFFRVHINEKGSHYPLQHFHTIDPLFYLKMNNRSVNIAYCHFLPDTLKGSLKIPGFVLPMAAWYIIRFYNKADFLVVVNPSFIDELVRYGIDRKKIEYIPNFVSDEEFFEMDKAKRDEIRRQLGIAPEKFVVLGCGQVQTRKGVKEFVEVARSMPDIQFVWAGGFSFGKLTDGYEELKEIMDHPPENVIFTGIVPREKMNGIFNASDLLFIPSYAELFPMTILEASNAGKPILTRDLELYEDILFDHYLKGNNNQEFIEAIRTLETNPQAYQRQKEHARALAEFYSKENVLELWKEFYNRAYRTKFS